MTITTPAAPPLPTELDQLLWRLRLLYRVKTRRPVPPSEAWRRRTRVARATTAPPCAPKNQARLETVATANISTAQSTAQPLPHCAALVLLRRL
jgi:hypothetical protein